MVLNAMLSFHMCLTVKQDWLNLIEYIHNGGNYEISNLINLRSDKP